jgi:hypothetical protein
MRTLLRKVSTGLYFRGPDQWTSNPAEAKDFKLIDRAIAFVQRWRLKDVEVAFAFDRAGAVKRMPVDKLDTQYSE